MTQKRFDIIVPCYNNWRYTNMCISSIIEKSKDYNLIIVNNGSSDETTEELTKLSMDKLNIHVINLVTNIGWVGAINEGIKYVRQVTKSPIIILSNNDVIVSSGWLDNYDAVLRSEPNIGMVSGISNHVLGKQNINTASKEKTDLKNVQYLITFNAAIRSDVVDLLYKIDGFLLDPRFNNGASDDLDLSIRIRKLGYLLIIDKKTYIHHFGSVTLKADMEEQKMDEDNFYVKYLNVLRTKWPDLGDIIREDVNVLIGVPTVGLMDYRFWLSTVTAGLQFKHSFKVMVRRPPDVARNELIDFSIKAGYTHTLFLDDDMVWDDQYIFSKLIAHNVDVVGVKAFTRMLPHFPCVFFYAKDGSQFYQQIDFDNCGLREVDGLGASMLLVKNIVFEKMKKPYFKFEPVQVLGRGASEIGEDLYFCKNVKEAGYRVWCDTDIEIGHIGDNKIITRKSYVKG